MSPSRTSSNTAKNVTSTSCRVSRPLSARTERRRALLEAELEEKHDVYIYEVELLTPEGVVRELGIDATTGRLLKDKED